MLRVYCLSKSASLRIFAAFCACLAAAVITGCGSVAYYGQATAGHLALLSKRRPIDKVLADPAVPQIVKTKLSLVQDIRRFASSSLQLPDNDSYRSYADLNRRYVVWNVFATPTLTLEPIESCFVIIGCLTYRGYYSETKARAFAAELRQAGNDVYVGGVAAYSTLGWFDDPVLNTMLYWDDRRLARLIFHELTHQLLYVKDDTLFNESFATNFAEIGLRRWSSLTGTNKQNAHQHTANPETLRELDFIGMIQDTQRSLTTLYASTQNDPEKLAQKKKIFDELRASYLVFKQRWKNYDGYDEWMNTDLNNAKIASVVTYHSYDEAFQHLLAQSDHELEQFIAKVKAIAALDEIRRHDCLRALVTNKEHQCGT
ncbi:MAG: aminopeptidase [Gammaproteobacteria bacterium]